MQVELSLWLTHRVFTNVRSDLIQGKVDEYGVGDNVVFWGAGGGKREGGAHKAERCFYTESSAISVSDFSLVMSVFLSKNAVSSCPFANRNVSPSALTF